MPSHYGQWHYTVAQVVGQLGMFNNLYPSPDRNIWPARSGSSD